MEAAAGENFADMWALKKRDEQVTVENMKDIHLNSRLKKVGKAATKFTLVTFKLVFSVGEIRTTFYVLIRVQLPFIL